jgi:hypothetical protein
MVSWDECQYIKDTAVGIQDIHCNITHRANPGITRLKQHTVLNLVLNLLHMCTGYLEYTHTFGLGPLDLQGRIARKGDLLHADYCNFVNF